MPNGEFYLDQALTNVSLAWKNDSADFIAEKLFPVIPVAKRTGKFWAYNKDNLKVPTSDVRTGRSKTREASYGKSLEDFGPLSEHALKDFISKDELDMEDAPLNAESDVVDTLNEKMLIIEEKALAAFLTDPTVITHNDTLSGTSQWNDYSNSSPFDDIKNMCIQGRSHMLKTPNTLTFSWEVWLTLVDHPDLLDRIKWSATGVVGTDDMIKLFAPYGIEKIFVGKVQENNGKDGQADNLVSVWGKDAIAAYVTNTPGLRQVNGGYTLRLNNGKYVQKKDEFDPEGEWIRNKDYYDQMAFSTDCFFLLQDVIA
jgi:hypothetical protein